MKLIYLIGEPAVGKSTILKSFMVKRGGWVKSKPKKLLSSYKSGKVRVLGVYNSKELFVGTDKLAMNVITDAVEYFSGGPDELVIAEGDRLNNSRFFDMFDEKLIIRVCADKGLVNRRRVNRGSKQDASFLKRVATKCDNIHSAYADSVLVIRNEGKDDLNGIVDLLIAEADKYEST